MEFYKNRVSKYQNFDINSNIGLKWQFWSEDFMIFMIFSWQVIKLTQYNISQLKKLSGTNMSNISVFHSKYRISLGIPTPASPNVILTCYLSYCLFHSDNQYAWSRHNKYCRWSAVKSVGDRRMNTHAAWCFDEDNNEMECEIPPCACKGLWSLEFWRTWQCVLGYYIRSMEFEQARSQPMLDQWNLPV